MQRLDHNMETSVGKFSYRSAALIVKDRRLLVAKHVDHDCYYTIGGGINFNESSSEAAVREALEETGYVFEIDRLAYVHERFFVHHNRRQHEVAFYYLMKPLDGLEIKDGSFSDQGFDETLHWLCIDELPKTNLVPEFLRTRLQKTGNAIEHLITRE